MLHDASAVHPVREQHAAQPPDRPRRPVAFPVEFSRTQLPAYVGFPSPDWGFLSMCWNVELRNRRMPGGQLRSDEGWCAWRAGRRRSFTRTERSFVTGSRPERGRHDDIRDGDGWGSDLRCVCLHALGLLDQLDPVRVVIGADDGLLGPRVECRSVVRQLVMMRGQARAQHPQQGDQACGRHAAKIPREVHGTDDMPRTQVASSEVAPPAHIGNSKGLLQTCSESCTVRRPGTSARIVTRPCLRRAAGSAWSKWTPGRQYREEIAIIS
ncbi:hypothetical protein BH23GEM10_BH23GEM10_17140 [soil metagenome]